MPDLVALTSGPKAIAWKSRDKRFKILSNILPVDISISTPHIEATIYSACRRIRNKSIYQAVVDTVRADRQFKASKLFPFVGKYLAYVLAAQPELFEHGPISIPCSFSEPIIAGVEIVSASELNNHTIKLEIIVLTSIYASAVVELSMRESVLEQYLPAFCFYVGDNVATTRPIFWSVSDIIGMRIIMHLEPMHGHAFKCVAVYKDADSIRYNRRIWRMRNRFILNNADKLCPFYYEHGCDVCPHTDQTCKASFIRCLHKFS